MTKFFNLVISSHYDILELYSKLRIIEYIFKVHQRNTKYNSTI